MSTLFKGTVAKMVCNYIYGYLHVGSGHGHRQ